MSSNNQELLEKTRLHYLVAERLPSKAEVDRAQKTGAVLLRLAPVELVEIYDNWQAHYREHAAEPFIGTLVRHTANLSTDSEAILDGLEGALELLGPAQEELPLDTMSIMDEVAIDIAQHPEMTADSISGLELARLVLSVSIEHPLEQTQLFEKRQKYLEGDLSNPGFRSMVYRDHMEAVDNIDADFSGFNFDTMELERETDEEIDRMRDFIEAMGGREEYSRIIVNMRTKAYYDTQFDDLAFSSTTVQAAAQLGVEAVEFQFELKEKLAKK